MYKVLMGKLEGRRPLRRLRSRWEVGMRMDLKEIGWVGWGWSGFSWLRIGTGGFYECGNEPLGLVPQSYLVLFF
jgi:hypothetical protein